MPDGGLSGGSGSGCRVRELADREKKMAKFIQIADDALTGKAIFTIGHKNEQPALEFRWVSVDTETEATLQEEINNGKTVVIHVPVVIETEESGNKDKKDI